MSKWTEFVKDVARKNGVTYKEATKIASPLWKAKKGGISMSIKDYDDDEDYMKMKNQEKGIYDDEDDDKKWLGEDIQAGYDYDDVEGFDYNNDDWADYYGDGESDAYESDGEEPSVYNGKGHPYFKDFSHIRKRSMKGGGFFGDLWNGISSVLKPALSIFGGPIGTAVGALVPTINAQGGVKMLGQDL